MRDTGRGTTPANSTSVLLRVLIREVFGMLHQLRHFHVFKVWIGCNQGVCNSRFKDPCSFLNSISVSRLFDRMTRTTQTAAIVSVASYAATFRDGVFLRTVEKSIQMKWIRAD